MVLPSLYLHRKKRGRRGHYMFNGLVAYLDSIKARDPAPRSRWEILLYPGLLAVGMHRVAHWLFEARLFFLARFVNHLRSEEHTSELQSLMRISYAVFCLK